MLNRLWADVSFAGIHTNNNRFHNKRQVVFNQFVFFVLLASITRLIFMAVTVSRTFTVFNFTACVLPVIICIAISILSAAGRFNAARNIAFFVLPPAIVLLDLVHNDHGLSMFPLLFSVLCFFFFDRKWVMRLAYLLSSACFLLLQFENLWHSDPVNFYADLPLIVFNHLLILTLVYLMLDFMRRMVEAYQEKISRRNRELGEKNTGLVLQQQEIVEKSKALEERQQQLAQANLQKNKMLSVISHDLRTPVQSVKNLFDLYAKGVITREQFLPFIPEVNREMGNVLDLLENLLSWSKQQQENMQVKKDTLYLSLLVNDIVALYGFTAAAKHITIDTVIAPELVAEGDRHMIKTVLRNLVSNAIKFNRPGGTVTLGAEVRGNQVWLHVTDQGTGISPEVLERIKQGEEVVTRGTGGEYGSGLGLALCREFVQKNGGIFTIESQVGKGSTFSFSLPVSQLSFRLPGATKEVLKPVPLPRTPVTELPAAEK